MSSPLDRLANKPAPKKTATAEAPVLNKPVLNTALPTGSPLARAARTQDNVAGTLATPQHLRLPVTEADIDELGKDNSTSVRVTTDKIIDKFTVNNFEGLGDILTKVHIQADSLDVSEYAQKGIVGKMRRAFVDVRKMLYKRMNSANEAFNDLESKITDQVAVLSEWTKDLTALYQENYQNHLRLTRQIQQGESLLNQMEETVNNFPQIDPADPEAFIKSQQLQEARTLLNQLQIKIDTWNRLRIICESHGPNIQSKQQAGRNAIQTLKRLAEEMIPMVRMEFAMHLQNLEVQKSITLVDSVTELGNQTLTTAADSSRDAALAAARAANTPIISTSTLNHIRTRMLEAATGVNQIREQAQQTREADAVQLKASQAEYLTQLQKQGAV